MTTMTKEIDSGQGLPKDSRQDRLKNALRENLRRRKLQARERSKMTDEAVDERPPDGGTEDSGA